ncbi:MAG: MFS transporter [Nocardioides sp.]|uniref:MFS transporter n=1 Tax=Nocardioides sp. TaxID=35761 RepID=UPI0039E5666E
MNMRMLAIVAAITAFAPLSMDLYLPGLPDLEADLDASGAAAHATVTACIAGLALGQLVSGLSSPGRKRRPSLLVAMSVWVTVTVLCAFAQNIWVVAGLRVAQGLAAGVSIALARTVIADLDPENLTRHLSRLMVVLASVPILAPVLGGVALAVTDWRGLFLTLAALGLMLTVIVARNLPESRPAVPMEVAGTSGIRGALPLLGSARFLMPATVSGVGFGVLFAYIGVSAFIFRDHFGLSAIGYGIVFAVNAAAMIVGFQMAPLLQRWIGTRRAMLTGASVGAVGALAMLLASVVSPDALIPACALLTVVLWAAGIVVPLASSEAIVASRTRAAATSGVAGAMQFAIGGALGTLPDLLPGRGAVPLAAVGLICLLVCVALVTRTRAIGAPAVEGEEVTAAAIVITES